MDDMVRSHKIYKFLTVKSLILFTFLTTSFSGICRVFYRYSGLSPKQYPNHVGGVNHKGRPRYSLTHPHRGDIHVARADL